MTYETESKIFGRRPYVVVEIDADNCANVFGVLPCTASGPAGSECFNTFGTCQDTPNFNRGSITYRFGENLGEVTPSFNLIPSLVGFDFSPTSIDPGKGIGRRAKVTLRFKDHPYHDRGIDPYLATRSYDASQQGTFWGKFLARNNFYEGRPIRVLIGYLVEPFSTAEFKEYLYLIDSIAGPDRNGNVTLIAKDILKLADDKRAVVPVSSEIELTADITSTTALSASIAPNTLPGSGYLRIGNEIMRFINPGGPVITIERAQWGTGASTHSSGDQVQLCKIYENVNVVDVVRDLLVNFATVDASYIPMVAWNIEKFARLSSYNLTTILSKPEGVNKLLSELSEQCQFNIWWDQETQEIKLRSRFAFDRCDPVSLRQLNETQHILRDSITLKRRVNDRLTQIWLYYDLNNYAESVTEAENFNRAQISVDTDLEGPNAFGNKRVKVLFSRWFDETNQNAAIETSSALAARFDSAPIEIRFALDAKDSSLKTGDFCQIYWQGLQNEWGEIKSPVFQIMEFKEVEAGHRFEYKALSVIEADRVVFGDIGPDTLPDYTLATTDQQCEYAFICDTATEAMSNGDPCYLIT